MPTGAPRRAHARPYHGQAWPCRGRGPLPYRSPKPSCRSGSRAPLRAVPRAPCPVRVTSLHGRIVSAQVVVFVGASRPCRRRSCRVAALRARVSRPSAHAPWASLCAQPAQLPSHNTIFFFCIAAKIQPNQAPQSRYKFFIVTLPSQSTAYLLQYTSKSCNIIFPSQYKMGSSKFPIFCTIFFFVISNSKKITKIMYNNFFSFPATVKIKKFTYFFIPIFHNTQINQ